MYHKYQTEAIILKSRESAEADRVIVLYTEAFGFILARATGVRKENSRMRYALQHYSHADVALVRGKKGWRVAGASSRGGIGGGAGALAFARIAELVTRLVHGEEENPYLFATLVEAHSALRHGTREILGTVELVCVARVLFALGYLSAEALETTLFTHTAYAEQHLREAVVLRERMLRSINQAIADTHL